MLRAALRLLASVLINHFTCVLDTLTCMCSDLIGCLYHNKLIPDGPHAASVCTVSFFQSLPAGNGLPI